MIDPKIIDDLKAKHSDLHLLEHDGVEMVFKRPSKEVYRRFKKLVLDEDRRAEAAERLIFDCLAWPDAPTAQVALEKQPGLVDTFASSLADLAGAAKKASTVVPL
jgi:hypothetical protein